MRIIRTVAGLVGLLLLAAALFAAGSQESGNEGGDTTVLRVALWDYESLGYDRQIMERYMELNPDVEIEVFDSTAADYDSRLAVMLTGGEEIDVYYAKNMNLYGGVIRRNQARPLNDLIERDNIDLSGYGDRINAISVDGTVYGLPYRSDSIVLYYNRRIFDEAGEPYPTHDWTWDDFERTAARLSRGEGQDRVWGALLRMRQNMWYTPALQLDMGNLLTGDLEMMRPALELQMRMTTETRSAMDWATIKSQGSSERAVFGQDRTALHFNGTWFINQLIVDEGAGRHNVDWDMVRLPTWVGMPTGTRSINTPVVINPRTENLEAAWDLVQFIAGQEGAKILAENLLIPGWLDDEVFEVLTTNPDFPAGGIEGLEYERAYLDLPPQEGSGLVGQMIYEEISLVATENKGIDEAIADMERRRAEILAQ